MRTRIEEYLTFLLEEEKYSSNTVAAYRNDLVQFVQWLDEQGRTPASWGGIQSDDISEFLFFLRAREYAPSTIARKMAAVKSFCKHLVEREEMTTNPTEDVDSPRVQKQSPEGLSRESITRLMAAPASLKNTKGVRDRAMLELLYGTGLRVSELVNLGVDDLDQERWTIRCGKGASARTVPVSVRAMGALNDYLTQDNGRVSLAADGEEASLFLNMRGGQLTRQGLWLIIKHYVEQAGIEEDVTPHTLRHAFAIHHLRESTGRVEERLVELQELLGHANISTTQIYLQNS